MHVSITLPDGSELEVEAGSTVEDVAYEIGSGLGRDTVAGIVDGELVAKEQPIESDVRLEIVTEDSEEYLSVLRHTAAHVFAQALQRLHPEAKLAIGPWTEDGFYYDISGVELDEGDLEEIEAEAQRVIDEDLPVKRREVHREEAEDLYEDNRFKLEILEEEASDADTVTLYEQGEFYDLCRGPHVDSTGKIGGFALLEMSAAYWRGDERNQSLTRVYGTAFPSQSELEDYLDRRRKAAERDHRKIGREMDLFSIPSVTGPGLPLYHPNGKKILTELENYVNSLNEAGGYDLVETPHVFKTQLWEKSGHYDNYQEDMFLFDVGDDEYGLKPMNCPGHTAIFDQRSWSYRDLPVRYSENGKVYRREQRGELSGLSRVWAFTIDDGHLFVRPDQIQSEVGEIIEMILSVLETFDLEYDLSLATRPEKSVGDDEIWERAESQLEAVLEEEGMEYQLNPGEGAFYGPKIDFSFEDALGRRWDGPTVQLDFNMPARFELTYTGTDNREHQPVLIHRALYGSFERFLMILIEHYDGQFPTWLAPEQLRILTITDEHLEYAESVADRFEGIRATIEERSWTIGKKIQTAHDDRVPYMLVLGDDEESSGTISVRDRFERERRSVAIDAFRSHLLDEIDEKRIEPDFLAE